jgi:hypothetical protein
MKTNLKLKKFIGLMLIATCYSCSTNKSTDISSLNLIDEPFLQEEIDLSQSNASLESSPNAGNDCFELRWLIPTHAVSVFHIKYGSSKTELDSKISIPVETLEKKNNLLDGPFYSYKLCNNKKDLSIFVQMAAENIYGISPFSEIVELKK